MAHTAKDGRRFQNHQEGRHYDRVLADRGKEKKASGKSEEADVNDKEDAPIEDVVAEHGPAEETRIEKKGDDEYSVHSDHEDGHKHSSHGHSLEEAHAHSMKAHGGKVDEAKATDNPEEEAEEMGGSGMHSAPPGMEGVGV